MSERTHSLREVAENHLPPQWTDSERWLARRLNRGELKGVKFGRTWMMRDQDIDHMLTHYSNNNEHVDTHQPHALSVADGLSTRSRRRLRTA